MQLAYAVDHENKIIYYDEKMKDVIPSLDYKKVKITSSISTSKIKEEKLFLFVSSVDNTLLYKNEWLGTHPNGLLLLPGVFFRTANASMGFIFQNLGLTAWHNVMIAPHSKGETPNVPMISYYDKRQWKVHILTRPAVFVSVYKKLMKMILDYDVAIVETTYTYPYKYPAVLGKEVCAYGVISATNGVATFASYLPSIIEVKSECPSLERGMEVTLASAYSGIRKGRVISTNVEIAYHVVPKFLIQIKKSFMIDIPSIPGDSGGAVYI
ncbi:virion structural protein [Betalipothrixvirus pozzuoliense]|uniref:Uncharacterized protein n=1 Tax=Betalipothrixvirus pozzuoliense TaxID=346882 RepID=A7WKJ8_9VIRU|nr:virion structural protein [Acidianus filamentous virus 6]CAJ31598.1 conserved hypothetical protein [Acidianus filamentous virus 6]